MICGRKRGLETDDGTCEEERHGPTIHVTYHFKVTVFEAYFMNLPWTRYHLHTLPDLSWCIQPVALSRADYPRTWDSAM